MTNQQKDNQIVHLQLPQSKTAAIYARVATRAKRTQLSQIEKLTTLAIQQGYNTEQIVVYEDEGVSAKTGIAAREGLKQLLEESTIHAILVSSEDRLFRDVDHTQVSFFIQQCLTQDVQVITPEMTYDFANPQHVALFRFQCEQSTVFIEKVRRQYAQKSNKQETKRH